ncbi:MAG TPA: DUF6307 family protein [Pseudonocardiaceae bacterium]|jgi:hypothetical protein|nr:DUF6307 family protein [Pseudonocardiaceae bacterium]
MATEQPIVLSGYELRLKMVTDAVRKHSKLGEKAATEVAVHVLHSLDTIPEKIR